MLYPLNIQIASIKRIAGKDRYGKPLHKAVTTDTEGFLTKNSLVTRNVNGSFSQIDATLLLHNEIKQQDLITCANGDKYYVFSVAEIMDSQGNIDHWSCQLTKDES